MNATIYALLDALGNANVSQFRAAYVGDYRHKVLAKGNTRISFSIREQRGGNESNTEKRSNRKTQISIQNSVNDLQIDSEHKTVTVRFRYRHTKNFVSSKLCLKLLFLYCLRKKWGENRDIFEWLLDHQNSAVPSIPGAYITVLKKIMWQKPVAELFKSTKAFSNEHDAYPKFTLVLRFANLVVQIFLLPSKSLPLEGEQKHNLNLHYFPAFVLDHGFDPMLKEISDPKTIVEVPFSFSYEDLSNEQLEDRDEVINLKYQSGRIAAHI